MSSALTGIEDSGLSPLATACRSDNSALGRAVIIGPLETVRLHQGHHADPQRCPPCQDDTRLQSVFGHAGHLKGAAIEQRFYGPAAGQAVAAYPGQISAWTEEEVAEWTALHRAGRRALFAVDLDQRFFSRLEGILLRGSAQYRVGAEEVAISSSVSWQGADQHRRRDLRALSM